MKYLSSIFLLVILWGQFACNKEAIVDTPTQVGISTVTYYVVLTVKGPTYQTLLVGESYTDSGVTSLENGVPVPYTTTGEVDVNAVGFYPITYSAVNKDGYTSSVTKYVSVLPTVPLPADFAGTYSNVGTAALTADITNVSPGVYFTTNSWGGSSTAVIPTYFFSTDGVNIQIPNQNSAAGNMDGTGDFVAGRITWTITLYDQGPFTATKKWQKQ